MEAERYHGGEGIRYFGWSHAKVGLCTLEAGTAKPQIDGWLRMAAATRSARMYSNPDLVRAGVVLPQLVRKGFVGEFAAF